MSSVKTPISYAHCWQLDAGSHDGVEVLYDGEHVVLVRGQPSSSGGLITLLFVREMFEVTCEPATYGIFPGCGRSPNVGPLGYVGGVIYHQTTGSFSQFQEHNGKRWSKKLCEALVAQAHLSDSLYPELRQRAVTEQAEKEALRKATVEKNKFLETLFPTRTFPMVRVHENKTLPSGATVADAFEVNLSGLTEDQVKVLAHALRAAR
jgi:hypothetical protein